MKLHKKENIIRTNVEEAFVHRFEEDDITMLHRCLRASIKVKLLSEEWARLDFALDTLSFQQGDLVLDQRLLLQHGETGENLLYAASLMRPDLLPSEIRPEPNVQQGQPLSMLLQAVSTRHTLLGCERQPAGYSEAKYFALELQALCLARTILSSLSVPVLLVHEIIPLRTSR